MTQTLAPDLPASQQSADDQVRNRAEAEVLRQLRGIRFGQLTLQVHDAHIVMIERTTRLRFDSHSPHSTT
jgi:hypothetical protein